MICPRCGGEMERDGHGSLDLYSCGECGYTEAHRPMSFSRIGMTNYERLDGMSLEEMAAFLAGGLGLDEGLVTAWMESHSA